MPIPIDKIENPFSPALDWKYGEGIEGRKTMFVRGVVEYNRDPEHRGRVMVRVLEDGPEMQIGNPKKPRVATFDLGWCEPMFGHGSGMGFGSFTVPPVGARVFVSHERGAKTNPLYFGGWVANSPNQRRYGVTRTTLEPPEKEYEEHAGFDNEGNSGGNFKYPPKPTPYQGHWMEEQGPEIPLELTEMIDHIPDTQMFFKTLKGASLLVKERDEAEEMVLTDRLGAELRFESNTPLVENGVLRRGRLSATQHEPMSLDNVTHNHKLALLTPDRSGLEIENNILGDDRLAVQLHPEQEIKKNLEFLPTRTAIELDPGEEKAQMVWVEDGVEVGHIKFDKLRRRLDVKGLDHTAIESDEDIILTAPRIKFLGDVEIEGEVKHFGGKKMVFMDNDMEPYGSQFRNWWPYDNRLSPYTEEPTTWEDSWAEEYKI